MFSIDLFAEKKCIFVEIVIIWKLNAPVSSTTLDIFEGYWNESGRRTLHNVGKPVHLLTRIWTMNYINLVDWTNVVLDLHNDLSVNIWFWVRWLTVSATNYEALFPDLSFNII